MHHRKGFGGKGEIMNQRVSTWRATFFKSIKIAVAAVVGIALAAELQLPNSATAGLITILSIRNTKRETVKSALNRVLAYLCALLIGAGSFALLDFSLWGFALFLFLFSLVCILLGWGEVLSVNAVLMSHFLIAGNMSPQLIFSESLLLLIGSTLGILVNLHLHKKGAEFDRLAAEVDDQIKGILRRMSEWLPREDKSEYTSGCFAKLETALEAARKCAVENYNNSFRDSDSFELDYITMRQRQSVILKEIYGNILSIRYLPKQANQVAAILAEIEEAYHRENTVEELLEKLDGLFREMEREPLPENRQEFEARAILFYILMQLKNLLEVKREFVLSRE